MGLNMQVLMLKNILTKRLHLDSLISNIDAKQASFTNFIVIISSPSIIGIGSIRLLTEI